MMGALLSGNRERNGMPLKQRRKKNSPLLSAAKAMLSFSHTAEGVRPTPWQHKSLISHEISAAEGGDPQGLGAYLPAKAIHPLPEADAPGCTQRGGFQPSPKTCKYRHKITSATPQRPPPPTPSTPPPRL